MEKALTFDIQDDELDIFVEDVNELLQEMESGILRLEQEVDPDTLNSAFRAAHTLKAVAGTVGHQAMAVPASQIIAHDPMRGLLSHRLVGWAAGLGWWGRNNLLVNPRFGSQMRYVTVLTDAELEPDEPLEADCGDCVACVEVCPAGAIQVERDQFDLARCKAKLDEFGKLPYISQHICGVCLKACSPQAVQQALGSREETGGSDTSA